MAGAPNREAAGLRVPFVVTIDTEGDNEWAKPKNPTDRNAAWLPRFQELCERYRLRPTYLVDHTMATSPAFQEFGRDVLARRKAEIGMHLHAWNSPPIVPLTARDHEIQPVLTAYPSEVMRQKIVYQSELLEQTFETPMLSHRAGRFGFDERYAAILAELGYLVDSSVTPHVNWEALALATRRPHQGQSPVFVPGGPDFSRCPEEPYWIDPDDLCNPAGGSSLLEVPVTIRNRWPGWIDTPRPSGQSARDLPKRILNRLYRARVWIYPRSTEEKMLRWIVQEGLRRQATHLMFFQHSSEFMPGGSPWTVDESDIERQYEKTEALFEIVAGSCEAMTLAEFHAHWSRRRPPA